MTSPRKTTELASAPVLFRLPNLYASDAACQREQVADHSATAVAGAGHASTSEALARHVDMPSAKPSPTPERPSDSVGKPTWYDSAKSAAVSAVDATASVTGQLALQRQDIFSKRSVLLLAMAFVACGSWIAGRQMAGRQAADTTGVFEPTAPLSARDALQGNAVSSETKITDLPKQAPTPEHQDSSPAPPARQENGHAHEDAVVSDSDFYQADDLVNGESAPDITQVATDDSSQQTPITPAVESDSESPSVASQTGTEETEEQLDPQALFAGLSQDALTPPANHRESTAAEAAAEPAAETAQTPLPSDQVSVTANSADVSPDLTVPDNKSPQRRRVLSRTPNDIPDWSRYLPGASGSVRAASAEGSSAPAGSSEPTDQQAFYLDNE